MALASANAANTALDAIGDVAAFVSLHTATTSTTGAAEEAGEGYARQSVVWNPAATSAMTNVTALSFTTPGTTPITHIGTWTLISGGTFLVGAALGAPVTAATITIAAAAISLGCA
jgi:hypothetical protein